ncbi:lipopolysaccharide biosynthesis protein [Ornithinimicrobium sp. LYQ103]|uniref:lipopolysaccharide biosynthesis protein n=1 Tax=Ornithinimicrobium sp. LYQ103 TaxID=3378796 RepID=UPI003851BDFC
MGISLYGAWITIVSLTSMLVWADLGLGSGLLTRLSRHLARQDELNARRDIFATYTIVASVGTAVAAAGLVTPTLLSWSRVLGTEAQLEPLTAQIAVSCIVIFAFNMPLSLIQRVQYAAGEVSLSNIFTAAGPIISLVLTFAAVHFDSSPVTTVLAASVGPLIGNMTATVWFFSRHRTLIPSWTDRAGSNALQLLSLGGLFVLISTFSAVANNSDNLIIAQVLDADAVASYGVPARLMAAMGLLINLVNLPLWPANANAMAKGDYFWVRRTTVRMTLLSAGFVSVVTCVLIVFGERVSSVLSRGQVSADPELLVALGVWWTVVAATSPAIMVQNAAGVLWPQLLGWAAFLVTTVPLKIGVAEEFGINAIPLAGVICYVVTVVPACYFGYRRALRGPTNVGPT